MRTECPFWSQQCTRRCRYGAPDGAQLWTYCARVRCASAWAQIGSSGAAVRSASCSLSGRDASGRLPGMRSTLERGWLRAGAVVAIAGIVGVAVGTPAGAAGGDRPHRDRRIGISGGVVMASDETVNCPVVSVDGPAVINGVVTDKVYVGRGDARINGRVTGDVFVVDGDAIVNGRVGGDVIAVLGRVTVHSD